MCACGHHLPQGGNFINVKRARFSYECPFSSYFSALVQKFRTKNARINVDEIDGRWQFTQHFMSSLYAHISQKHKKDWQLDCFYSLLGSGREKLLIKCWGNWLHVAISTTFYEQNLSCKSLMCSVSVLWGHWNRAEVGNFFSIAGHN